MRYSLIVVSGTAPFHIVQIAGIVFTNRSGLSIDDRMEGVQASIQERRGGKIGIEVAQNKVRPGQGTGASLMRLLEGCF